MSAFMVNKEHIDALVWLARREGNAHGPIKWCAWGDSFVPDDVGRMLWAENARSVGYRYGEDAEDVSGYAYAEPRQKPTHAEGARLVACYSYQACECEDWESTEAAKFCRALTGSLVWDLSSKASDVWGWPPATERGHLRAV